MPAGLVSIGFDSDTLDATPTYEGVDSHAADWTIDRGRQFELDDNQAGVSEITLLDTEGILDVLNGSSTYNGKLEPLKPIRIQEPNPVTAAVRDQYTGFIEDWDYAIDPTSKLLTIKLSCVDAFDVFANTEVVPGSTGEAIYVSQQVDDGLRARLADVGWDSSLTDIFTGNVWLKAVTYQPGTDQLTTLSDASRAEFPGVANHFMDRSGKYAFRGRLARFNPDDYTPLDGVTRSPSRPIRQWNLGDSTAVVGHSDWVKIAELEWNVPKIRIYNGVLATPEGIRDADVPGQLVVDATSIGKRGTRSLKLEGLLTDGNVNTATTDLEEVLLFAEYFKANYKDPHPRVTRCVIRAVDPADAANAATWDLLTDIEIGDLVFITTTNPGGGGFSATGFFVDGIHQRASIGSGMNTDTTHFLQRELSLDLTPQALYANNPF